MRQILNESISMYDVQSDKVMNLEAMQKKCGYTPARGDRSSNADGGHHG